MLLRNLVYLGKVDFKGARYEGEHDAIVDAPLFELVQRTLDAKACGRGPRRGRNPKYLLQLERLVWEDQPALWAQTESSYV